MYRWRQELPPCLENGSRQGKVKAFALSGTRRRVWRFRKHELDSALLSNTVECRPLTVLAERRTP